ncbi:hypothetical protein I6N98_12965 [Spongiibacter nanhainus]|uniref:GLTT repeat-containing protein n=1 Tax=Spongiibacter nanhainus TaxID=2794344 RepID=A0A7T4UP65_9GAMM|nr:hypothetical protein [Spongiibacter nanhainus]QQD17272.1 hypothetical protein I6N98_12965 [Spongiibacter nanhainus]
MKTIKTLLLCFALSVSVNSSMAASPLAGLPVVGDLLGGDLLGGDLLVAIPVVGDLLGGGVLAGGSPLDGLTDALPALQVVGVVLTVDPALVQSLLVSALVSGLEGNLPVLGGLPGLPLDLALPGL